MAVKWRIDPVSDADKKKYLALAQRMATKYRIPYKVVAGVIEQESKYDPTSYRWSEENEKDRSFGLMHLTVPTGQEMANKLYGKGMVQITADALYNPETNVELGAFYLRKQYDRFKKPELTTQQNWDRAVSSYNAGRPISGNMGSYVANVFTKGAMLTGTADLASLLIGGLIAWVIYRRMEAE